MSGKPTITPYDAILGKSAKAIRENAAVSQEKIAEILECSVSMISLLEGGKRSWKQTWVYKFCQFFSITPLDMYSGIEGEDIEFKEFFNLLKPSEKKQALGAIKGMFPDAAQRLRPKKVAI